MGADTKWCDRCGDRPAVATIARSIAGYFGGWYSLDTQRVCGVCLTPRERERYGRLAADFDQRLAAAREQVDKMHVESSDARGVLLPSVRRYLFVGGYQTFGDLRRASGSDLLAIRGIGPRSVEDVRKAIKQLDQVVAGWIEEDSLFTGGSR